MQISISRQLGLQPATVGNFFMNARRRLHDKWQEMHNLNDDASGDESLMNDEDTDFVNDLVAEAVHQHDMDPGDLQVCLGHDGVQTLHLDDQVDPCGMDMDVGRNSAHHHSVLMDDVSQLHHHSHHLSPHLHHHVNNKELNVRMSVPHSQDHLQHQLLNHNQHQHQHQHHPHAYSLTSL